LTSEIAIVKTGRGGRRDEEYIDMMQQASSRGWAASSLRE